MGITRILDLIVIMLLATMLLMPRPDATVKPALALDGELRERVAELQSLLVGKPDDADASLELANIYLDGHRPDWALAAATPRVALPGNDYRFQHLRAIAYADRFEGAPAFEAAEQGAGAVRGRRTAGRPAVRRRRPRPDLAAADDAGGDRARRHEEPAVPREGKNLPRSCTRRFCPRPEAHGARHGHAQGSRRPAPQALTRREARRQHPALFRCARSSTG